MIMTERRGKIKIISRLLLHTLFLNIVYLFDPDHYIIRKRFLLLIFGLQQNEKSVVQRVDSLFGDKMQRKRG